MNQMADFRYMTRGSVARSHDKDVEFLSTSNPDVIVTHHLPAVESIPKQFASSSLNCYFVTPGIAEKLQPRVWIHGHTHSSMDYTLGRTRVLCNPLGYPGERSTGWDPEKTVDVG